MNEDILTRKWKKARGMVREFWEKLTEDDVARIDGSTEILAALLVERYGFSDEVAHDEINHFLVHVEGKPVPAKE